MRVCYITDETDERMKQQGWYDGNPNWQFLAERRTKTAETITLELNAPIDLSTLAKVNYDTKAGLYTALFVGGEKSATLRCTDEVADFLLNNLREPGTWRGRTEKGILVDVVLISYHRN